MTLQVEVLTRTLLPAAWKGDPSKMFLCPRHGAVILITSGVTILNRVWEASRLQTVRTKLRFKGASLPRPKLTKALVLQRSTCMTQLGQMAFFVRPPVLSNLQAFRQIKRTQ